ncbi:hypothetical protein Tco_1080582 [Tanacetum coccineum]|uniref:Reverse transcriptase domain-containing protein n=1 Tax=Tanacetum coccineum TaxID=301880 RepID=A0ABQ5HWR0_9ASTR
MVCSFVYAHNRYTQRRGLWSNLALHKHYIRNRPWSLLGDFNAALNLDDKSVGSLNFDISIREFKECVEDIKVSDVNYTGLKFTWNQKLKGDEGILKMIDRIMANIEFYDSFVGAYAIFQPYRISDHAPAVLKVPMVSNVKPKTFKFSNVLVHDTRFKDLVKEEWSNTRLRIEVDQVQRDLDKDPYNQVLREEEVAYVKAFNDALLMEERFLKQKAKIEWLRVGDSNSAYFHKGVHQTLNSDNLFCNKLDSNVASFMIRSMSNQEVKEAIFSMGNDKSPGPDGYTADFFKEAWDIVSNDVTKAVKEFFTNGTLLKEVNHTIIALIPKIASPTRINDYQPISCCNVIYKCISKIIANRIKDSLKTLVSPNQSAFVPGRRISDNILLTQEIMHNYHLDRGPPRCAFKVDSQKAYDTVDWAFLRKFYLVLDFTLEWLLGLWNVWKRGLRQGDPLSPYIFTLIMEVFTLMLQRKVRDSNLFTYHRYYDKLKLTNLCFADDLFLFAHGDANSACVIMACLDEFKGVSGLVPSLPKSTAYFCNVLNHTKLAILNIISFEERHLPVKYLGVPLISSRLIYRDCKELIDKVRSRIQDWKNKSLLAAGRLQLIRSVIGSMHVYWASVFILPSRILLDIEQLMRGFLWCQGDLRKGKAKVAWEVVYLPRNEGGLGIRRLDVFNKALMVSHI